VKKKTVFVALAAILVLAYAYAGSSGSAFAAAPKKAKGAQAAKEEQKQEVPVEESFRKTFPQITFDKISPTAIKGVYEVIAGPNIGYYAPEPGYIIFGEIRDKNMTSITANRKNELIAAKAKDLPLDKAIKIGNGKSTVIEFTDPDCPYCRKASAWFKERTDVTRYVFFMPLPMHPDAENKTKYVLCQEDRAKAYEEVMSGKLDNQKYEVCKKPEVESLLTLYKDLAAKQGINSTPFFMVNGKPVSGADFPRLEEALKAKP
jgi:thiol:disulfide interchange protein DsbC